MSGIAGIRPDGASSLLFVTVTDADLSSVIVGARVEVETEDGGVEGIVVIAPSQFAPTTYAPVPQGTLRSVSPIRDDAETASREDELYRARKADYPSLGSSSEQGTVVQISMRNRAYDVADSAGTVTSWPIGDPDQT